MAKNTQSKKQSEHSEFLSENIELFNRVKAGIDVHPSEAVIEKYNAIAKELNPEIHWQLKGCQECVNALVNFVHTNINKGIPVNSEGGE